MIRRWLFRAGVLVDEGDSLRTFDEVSKQDDFMLTCMPSAVRMDVSTWYAYRMCFFDSPQPSWQWIAQGESTVNRLRTLLLLQKS